MSRRFTRSQATQANALPTSGHEADISSALYRMEVSLESSSPSLWFVQRLRGLPPRIQAGPPHTKNQKENHIPRCRNCFMVFRSHTMGQGVLPDIPFCRNNQHVSCIVGHLWRALPDGDKERFRQMSDEEQIAHKLRYPSYKIPGCTSSLPRNAARSKSLMSEENQLKCKAIAEIILTNVQGDELFSQVQAVVDTGGQFTPTSQALPPRTKIPKVESMDLDFAVAAPKMPTRKTRKQPANAASKPRSSSTQTSKDTLASIYAGMANLPRAPRVSYAELSDNEVDEVDSDDATVCSPPESTPSLKSRSVSVESADQSASIATPSMAPPIAEEVATEYFDWTVDASLHDRAFGDEDSFDEAYTDFEDCEDFHYFEDSSSPYASFDVRYLGGFISPQDTVYYETQQPLYDDEKAIDIDCSGAEATQDH